MLPHPHRRRSDAELVRIIGICARTIASGILLASCGAHESRTTGVSANGQTLAAQIAPTSGIRLRNERFSFASETLRHTASDEIDESAAAALATAFGKNFSSWELLEKSSGRRIDGRVLTVCGVARYAASRFEPLDETSTRSQMRQFGPFWIVPVCGDGQQRVATIAVSALAAPLSVDTKGNLSAPMGSDVGSVFFWTGIPSNDPEYAPLEPEASALALLRVTGRRLARTPELIAPDPRENLPTHASWLVELDGENRVRTTAGENIASRRFEVGVGGDFREPGSRVLRVISTSPAQSPRLARPAATGHQPKLRAEFAQLAHPIVANSPLP